MFALYLLWGLLVGLVVGLTAVGVGLVGTPGLMLLFGMEDLVAVGTMSFCGIFMQMAGAAAHLQQRNVDWKVAASFGLTAAPSAFCAARMAEAISRRVNFKVLIGLVVVAAVVAMLLSSRGREEQGAGEGRPRRRILLALVLGGVCGFLVGATSITGSIIVVAFLVCLRMRVGRAVGTTVFVAAPALLFGTLGHGLAGRINWGAAWGLLPGVVVGAALGSMLVKRFPPRILRAVVVVVLLVAGVWVMAKGLWGQ